MGCLANTNCNYKEADLNLLTGSFDEALKSLDYLPLSQLLPFSSFIFGCKIKPKVTGSIDTLQIKLAITDKTDVGLFALLEILSAAKFTLDLDVYHASLEDFEQAVEIFVKEYSLLEFAFKQEEASQNEADVIDLADRLLLYAVKISATDIHLTAEENFYICNLRIDGILNFLCNFNEGIGSRLLSRLKLMSSLDITEVRLPQDGFCSIKLPDREVNFRTSSLPNLYGETLVLRVLDPKRGLKALDDLNLDAQNLATIKQLINLPQGLLLVCGPTGSGKTSFLYSILNELRQSKLNIKSLEDPSEYPLEGISQTNIKDSIGLDYATGVRSILRQDPDVILIGEIRDKETASMAMRSVLTGHRVFSTLHASSFFGVITRFIDLGVGKDVIRGNINAVVNQRLIRVLCESCKLVDEFKNNTYKAVGCAICGNTGYRGLQVVMELLKIDETVMDDLFNYDDFTSYVKKQNTLSMEEQIRNLILAGKTDFDELRRVIGSG